MKFGPVLLLSIYLIFFHPLNAMAEHIKVIANESVKADSISPAELKAIFLEERNSLRDGAHVEPVFEKDGAVHEIFLKECLGKSNQDLQNHYRTLVFTGKASMPKAVGSDIDMVAYVAKTRGAIGYVGAEASAEGVKTLTVMTEENESERVLLTRVNPEYPETLKQLKIGGTVRLEFTVSPEGRVENVRLLGGNAALAEASIKAVQQWTYSAYRSRTTLQVSIPFNP